MYYLKLKTTIHLVNIVTLKVSENKIQKVPPRYCIARDTVDNLCF